MSAFYTSRSRLFPVLALASAASLLELGPIATLLRSNAGLAAILFAGLAYQLGNGLPRLIGPTPRYALAPAATLGVLGLIFAHPATLTWYAAIGCLSGALQAIRRGLCASPGSDLPSTPAKRTARVVGFIVATVAPIAVWLPIVGMAYCMAIAWPNCEKLPSSAILQPSSPSVLEATMVLHQAHYFSYCYAIPLLVARNDLGGMPFVGLWFAVGWISYLSAEALWRRFPPYRVFVIGHLCLVLLLGLLAVLNSLPWAVVVIWALSGLGGGSVYCLTIMHKAVGLRHERLERAEDAGHVLGVVAALTFVLLLNGNVAFLPALASAWAALAVATMMIFRFALRTVNGSVNITAMGGTNANQ